MAFRSNVRDNLCHAEKEMLYLALLHYPVYDKNGRIVTTAIANMDIHDIARVAKTYGAAGFYIVNPAEGQRRLAQDIVNHWQKGFGAKYNPDRQNAFRLIHIRESLQDVVDDIVRRTGRKPKSVATDAGPVQGDVLTFAALKDCLKEENDVYLLLFGTGSGISEKLIRSSDFRLEPVQGMAGYNHLSVRSAVAVIMDRLTRD